MHKKCILEGWCNIASNQDWLLAWPLLWTRAIYFHEPKDMRLNQILVLTIVSIVGVRGGLISSEGQSDVIEDEVIDDSADDGREVEEGSIGRSSNETESSITWLEKPLSAKEYIQIETKQWVTVSWYQC